MGHSLSHLDDLLYNFINKIEIPIAFKVVQQ